MENNKISLQANQMKNKDREKKLKHQSRKWLKKKILMLKK